MTRRLAVVLLVGLAVTVGVPVGGVGTFHPADAATAPTAPLRSATTAETPTSTATPSDGPTANDAGTQTDTGAFPPGTSASGIDDATRLLRTHRSVLNDTTYSTRTNVTRATAVTGENETFRGFEVGHISIAADRGTDATRVRFADENLTYENGTSVQSYWVTDEAVATKTVDGSTERRTTMYQYSPTGGGAAAATGLYAGTSRNVSATLADPSFLLRPYLLGLDYGYAGTVVRDGRTLYRFRSSGVNATAVEDGDLADFPASAERVESTVLVSERGVVRSFDASAARSRGGETVTTGLTYAVPRVGNVTPEPPRWFATQLPHLDASLSSDGAVVAVNHTGGASVSTAGLLVHSSSLGASGTYTGTFEPGDTLYLYLTPDTDRVQVTRNDPPEVDESFVRFEGENVSITPWRLVVEGGRTNRTTVEVAVGDGAANRTVSPSDPSALPLGNSIEDGTLKWRVPVRRLMGPARRRDA